MKVRSLLAAATALSLVTVFAIAADQPEVKLDGIKCVMNPKGNAKAETAVDYKAGKIYFCCNNCPGKFDAQKNAVAANQQLVATRQYKQVNCPMTGKPCKTEHKTSVANVEVCFCCPNCKGKCEKADSDAARAEMVFNNKAFDKAFKPVKAEKKQSIQ